MVAAQNGFPDVTAFFVTLSAAVPACLCSNAWICYSLLALLRGGICENLFAP